MKQEPVPTYLRAAVKNDPFGFCHFCKKHKRSRNSLKSMKLFHEAVTAAKDKRLLDKNNNHQSVAISTAVDNTRGLNPNRFDINGYKSGPKINIGSL